MSEEREEMVCFDESTEIEWRQWFVDFRERVYPMFKEQGFTFVEAVAMWRQEQIITNLNKLLEINGA